MLSENEKERPHRSGLATFHILITLVALPNYVLCIGGDCRAELVIAPGGQCTDAHAFDA